MGFFHERHGPPRAPEALRRSPWALLPWQLLFAVVAIGGLGGGYGLLWSLPFLLAGLLALAAVTIALLVFWTRPAMAARSDAGMDEPEEP